ncbi:3110_t:CDS:1, partial [Gigaspora rosea]
METITTNAFKSNRPDEIKKNPTIRTKLGVFVRQVVKAILVTQDEKKEPQNVFKRFDEYTIDLEILTKLGIVGLLPVWELLG